MTRLIDGDALEKAIYEWMPKDQETWMDSKIPPIENLVISIMMTIQEQPTVDAEPVRHGKWMKSTERNKEWWWFCSNCQEHYFEDDLYINEKHFPKYCPNCGAKLDGGEHGTDK